MSVIKTDPKEQVRLHEDIGAILMHSHGNPKWLIWKVGSLNEKCHDLMNQKAECHNAAGTKKSSNILKMINVRKKREKKTEMKADSERGSRFCGLTFA